MTLEKLDLPRHPLEQSVKCVVCAAEFTSIPVVRTETPGDMSKILEQHVCPAGHVFTTVPGQNS